MCCSKAGCIGLGWFFLVCAAGLLAIAVTTDYWYIYDTKDVAEDSAARVKYDYYFGLTRVCYRNYNHSTLLREGPTDDGYKYNLVQCFGFYGRKIANKDDQEKFDILGLCVYSCLTGSILILFLSHWLLVGGVWSGQTVGGKKCCYASSGAMVFIGSLLSAASLICFIAQRQYEDGDKIFFPQDKGFKAYYGWSFFTAWAGVASSLFSSFLLILSALRYSACCGGDDEFEKGFDLPAGQYPGSRY